VSPTGNAVDLEEQMMKSSQTNMDYQMMSNLYGKNMDMLRSTIRGQN
jgi:flagellar basal-body rod protein FlgB